MDQEKSPASPPILWRYRTPRTTVLIGRKERWQISEHARTGISAARLTIPSRRLRGADKGVRRSGRSLPPDQRRESKRGQCGVVQYGAGSRLLGRRIKRAERTEEHR